MFLSSVQKAIPFVNKAESPPASLAWIQTIILLSDDSRLFFSVPLFPQLEDDIVAKPNYFATMKNFALQLSSEDWMILEFSQLGFIGMIY